MKKFLCLILAIVTMCGVLVSCNDNILTQAEDAVKDFNLPIPEKEPLREIDFYIITESDSDANRTVASQLKDKFTTSYNTVVNMHYIPEEKYHETVLAENSTLTAGKASVILVDSEDFYNELKEKGVLVNLEEYYSTASNPYNYNYPTLNKQIGGLLALAQERVQNENGDFVSAGTYAIPNNGIYGTYKFLSVNSEMIQRCRLFEEVEACIDFETNSPFDFAVAETKINALKDSFNSLIENDEAVRAEANRLGFSSADDFVRIVEGYYGDFVEESKTNFCELFSFPTKTRADALSSAFVVAGDSNPEIAERAMRAIYAVNTNVEIRNILQYGLETINYTKKVSNGVTYVSPFGADSESTDTPNTHYKMSLKYTGDINLAYYCETSCVLCTSKNECENGEHVYLTPDNKAMCNTWIDYHLGEGESFDSKLDVLYGLTNSILSLEDYVPVKESVENTAEGYKEVYTFVGWYTSMALTSETAIKEVVSTLNVKTVVTLYPKWEATRVPLK